MNHDVAIVGGGLVGSTLALALARAGLRVALLESRVPAPVPTPTAGWALRVSAVSVASRRVLTALGAWRYLPQERLGPFRHMHVWERRGRGEIHFDAAQVGVPELGFIVENERLQQALEMALAVQEGVRWYRPAALEDFEVTPERVVLRAAGTRLRARLLVGADGTRSPVRALAGIETEEMSYEQRAVVATVHPERPHQETAWQRFLPRGPLAFLPLPGNACSIVWSTTPQHAEELLAMPDEDFGAALEDAYQGRLGTVHAQPGRAAFALASLHARRYVGERLALVGDAAHTIHPLAGQGVNLGFLDAAALADVLATASAAGRDIGRLAVLRRYERWRRGHNTLVRGAMTGFSRLFGSPLVPVRMARNLGLALTDQVAPAKRLFMLHASGLAGDLPPLAGAS